MKLLNIELKNIIKNVNQPRKHFDNKKMEELKESIKNNGLIQPIVVRKLEKGVNKGKYEIIAGERRFRAFSFLKMEKIQCIVISAGDNKSYEYSILENIQRENLNPIEEANSYVMLMEVYGYTQENLASKLGKTRSAISNKIRLLKLPDKVKNMVKEGVLSYGHARAILSITDEKTIEELSEKIINKKYSVREVENLVKKYNGKEQDRNKENLDIINDENMEITTNDDEKIFLEKKLAEFFESRVKIKGNLHNQGKIEIDFYDYEDLGRIIELLNINFE